MARRRYPKISLGDDGLYHAWVVVGTKPNGRPDQRHVKRRTAEEVEERVDELLDQKKAGTITKPGRPSTVRQWLETYFGTVAARRCDPTTIHGYRSKMRNYVYPIAGTVRMDRLTPELLLVKLDAQETYAQARRAEVSALVELNIAVAELAQSAGTILDMRMVESSLASIAPAESEPPAAPAPRNLLPPVPDSPSF